MSDVLIAGGGLVGAACAYGLLREGMSVTVLDEGDVALRASRGNFGLVWVQSKGDGSPAYAEWTRRSADLWPEFAAMMGEETGIETYFEKPGGLTLLMSESEMEARASLIARMHNIHSARMLDRREVADMVPGIGPDVRGASYCPHDGHASPLHLLRALHTAITRRGGKLVTGARIERLEAETGGFRAETAAGTFRGAKVILAAGLGNRALAPSVGLDVPVRPLKGQILVTERVRPCLALPTHLVRQTGEGTLLVGDSKEGEAGFDVTATTPIVSDIAARAVRQFPWLTGLRLVRAWGGLRVMTPDGFPIYEQSGTHPGAYTVNCHSGVTLAAVHALALAPMIARGDLGEELATFTAGRFHADAA